MCQIEQVRCLSLFVCLPVDFTSPILSFKHTKYFLSPFLPDWPPLSLSLSLSLSLLSLTFFILYYFPYHCLSTPVFLHTLFHQSFSPRQPQFSTVMGICTFDNKSEVNETTCAKQPGFVRRSCFIVN